MNALYSLTIISKGINLRIRRRIDTFIFTFRQISLIYALKESELSMITPRSLICEKESSWSPSITKDVGRVTLLKAMDWDIL